MEVANVLLSLQDDIRDDTQDEEDDNATLMPIGGIGAPVDVAPQEIKLDQPNVDASIAGLIQKELNQEALNLENSAAAPAPVEQQSIEQTSQVLDTLATGSKPVHDDNKQNITEKKGSLHMKDYGLKRKPTVTRTFKCSICESVKSSIQNLNTHHKRHHAPQMCGTCGHTFTLASSLTRHMYNHQTLQYKCEHCPEAFHFESELETHKVKHRNKNAPSFQCMKSKCGKWFMRKWDLTLHLQKHDKDKHYCKYDGCTFWMVT